MLYCLNPKKTHENHIVSPPSTGREDSSLSSLSSSPSALAQESSSAGEEQVTCRYCKYLLEGAVLGDCRLIRWIGSGSFGDVYEAEQLPPLKRRVAVKVMAVERILDEQAADLFAREVGTIASLDHPNILPVLRVGTISDGRSYLVMKYAAHGSLQQFCQVSPQALSILPTLPAQGIVSEQEGLDSARTRSIALSAEDEQAAGTEEPDEAQTPPTSSHEEAVEECETIVIEKPPEEDAAPAGESEPEAMLASGPALLTTQELLSYVDVA
jgi:hypothetical protein